MPEFTKPTTMTVVAEEDWITAVMPAPTRTPYDPVGSQPFQNLLHFVSCSGLQTAAHHLHSIEEKRKAAEQHSGCLLFSCEDSPLDF